MEFSSLRHSHKLPHFWLLGACPTLLPPEPLWAPGLFIYSPRKGSLPPVFSAQGTPPSFQRVFIALIAYYSVSLFSPGGGQSVQGAMLLWPRLVCGGTAVPRSSPGLCLPKPSGCRRLATRGPSWFLRLTREVEIVCTGLSLLAEGGSFQTAYFLIFDIKSSLAILDVKFLSDT
jgi:hypothetical protein